MDTSTDSESRNDYSRARPVGIHYDSSEDSLLSVSSEHTRNVSKKKHRLKTRRVKFSAKYTKPTREIPHRRDTSKRLISINSSPALRDAKKFTRKRIYRKHSKSGTRYKPKRRITESTLTETKRSKTHQKSRGSRKRLTNGPLFSTESTSDDHDSLYVRRSNKDIANKKMTWRMVEANRNKRFHTKGRHLPDSDSSDESYSGCRKWSDQYIKHKRKPHKNKRLKYPMKVQERDKNQNRHKAKVTSFSFSSSSSSSSRQSNKTLKRCPAKHQFQPLKSSESSLSNQYKSTRTTFYDQSAQANYSDTTLTSFHSVQTRETLLTVSQSSSKGNIISIVSKHSKTELTKYFSEESGRSVKKKKSIADGKVTDEWIASSSKTRSRPKRNHSHRRKHQHAIMLSHSGSSTSASSEFLPSPCQVKASSKRSSQKTKEFSQQKNEDRYRAKHHKEPVTKKHGMSKILRFIPFSSQGRDLSKHKGYIRALKKGLKLSRTCKREDSRKMKTFHSNKYSRYNQKNSSKNFFKNKLLVPPSKTQTASAPKPKKSTVKKLLNKEHQHKTRWTKAKARKQTVPLKKQLNRYRKHSKHIYSKSKLGSSASCLSKDYEYALPIIKGSDYSSGDSSSHGSITAHKYSGHHRYEKLKKSSRMPTNTYKEKMSTHEESIKKRKNEKLETKPYASKTSSSLSLSSLEQTTSAGDISIRKKSSYASFHGSTKSKSPKKLYSDTNKSSSRVCSVSDTERFSSGLSVIDTPKQSRSRSSKNTQSKGLEYSSRSFSTESISSSVSVSDMAKKSSHKDSKLTQCDEFESSSKSSLRDSVSDTDKPSDHTLLKPTQSRRYRSSSESFSTSFTEIDSTQDELSVEKPKIELIKSNKKVISKVQDAKTATPPHQDVSSESVQCSLAEGSEISKLPSLSSNKTRSSTSLKLKEHEGNKVSVSSSNKSGNQTNMNKAAKKHDVSNEQKKLQDKQSKELPPKKRESKSIAAKMSIVKNGKQDKMTMTEYMVDESKEHTISIGQTIALENKVSEDVSDKHTVSTETFQVEDLPSHSHTIHETDLTETSTKDSEITSETSVTIDSEPPLSSHPCTSPSVPSRPAPLCSYLSLPLKKVTLSGRVSDRINTNIPASQNSALKNKIPPLPQGHHDVLRTRASLVTDTSTLSNWNAEQSTGAKLTEHTKTASNLPLITLSPPSSESQPPPTPSSTSSTPLPTPFILPSPASSIPPSTSPSTPSTSPLSPSTSTSIPSTSPSTASISPLPPSIPPPPPPPPPLPPLPSSSLPRPRPVRSSKGGLLTPKKEELSTSNKIVVTNLQDSEAVPKQETQHTVRIQKPKLLTSKPVGSTSQMHIKEQPKGELPPSNNEGTIKVGAVLSPSDNEDTSTEIASRNSETSESCVDQERHLQSKNTTESVTPNENEFIQQQNKNLPSELLKRQHTISNTDAVKSQKPKVPDSNLGANTSQQEDKGQLLLIEESSMITPKPLEQRKTGLLAPTGKGILKKSEGCTSQEDIQLQSKGATSATGNPVRPVKKVSFELHEDLSSGEGSEPATSQSEVSSSNTEVNISKEQVGVEHLSQLTETQPAGHKLPEKSKNGIVAQKNEDFKDIEEVALQDSDSHTSQENSKNEPLQLTNSVSVRPKPVQPMPQNQELTLGVSKPGSVQTVRLQKPRGHVSTQKENTSQKEVKGQSLQIEGKDLKNVEDPSLDTEAHTLQERVKGKQAQSTKTTSVRTEQVELTQTQELPSETSKGKITKPGVSQSTKTTTGRPRQVKPNENGLPKTQELSSKAPEGRITRTGISQAVRSQKPRTSGSTLELNTIQKEVKGQLLQSKEEDLNNLEEIASQDSEANTSQDKKTRELRQPTKTNTGKPRQVKPNENGLPKTQELSSKAPEGRITRTGISQAVRSQKPRTSGSTLELNTIQNEVKGQLLQSKEEDLNNLEEIASQDSEANTSQDKKTRELRQPTKTNTGRPSQVQPNENGLPKTQELPSKAPGRRITRTGISQAARSQKLSVPGSTPELTSSEKQVKEQLKDEDLKNEETMPQDSKTHTLQEKATSKQLQSSTEAGPARPGLPPELSTEEMTKTEGQQNVRLRKRRVPGSTPKLKAAQEQNKELPSQVSENSPAKPKPQGPVKGLHIPKDDDDLNKTGSVVAQDTESPTSHKKTKEPLNKTGSVRPKQVKQHKAGVPQNQGLPPELSSGKAKKPEMSHAVGSQKPRVPDSTPQMNITQEQNKGPLVQSSENHPVKPKLHESKKKGFSPEGLNKTEDVVLTSETPASPEKPQKKQLQPTNTTTARRKPVGPNKNGSLAQNQSLPAGKVNKPNSGKSQKPSVPSSSPAVHKPQGEIKKQLVNKTPPARPKQQAPSKDSLHTTKEKKLPSSATGTEIIDSQTHSLSSELDESSEDELTQEKKGLFLSIRNCFRRIRQAQKDKNKKGKTRHHKKKKQKTKKSATKRSSQSHKSHKKTKKKK